MKHLKNLGGFNRRLPAVGEDTTVLLQFPKISPEFLIVLIIKLSALSTKQLKFSKYLLKLSGWSTPLLQVKN